MRRVLILFMLLMLPAAAPARDLDADGLWALLREGGAIAMIRHARAPGVGDPADFVLTDCATQRVLSEEGRAQARALGDRFRAQGVPVAEVLSSRWCRCLDTASLAFGQVVPFPPLDSFFANRETESVQTSALKSHLLAWRGEGTLVLVTHQVNITALTGIFPREGEMVVLVREGEVVVLVREDGDIRVAGRLDPTAGTAPK